MEEKYKTLEIETLSSTPSVYYLYLNTPSLKNALTLDFFTEFPKAITSLDQNPDVSVIVISSKTQHFCSGIHIHALNTITNQTQVSDRGRTGERLRRTIKSMQDSLTAIERCRKPVIAAISGGCIGGGIDLVTACDVRYCSKDAFFSVKEVDLAIVADLGTLQRLPRIVGFGNAMELALTGRRFSSEEAKNIGLVTKVFESKVELDDGVRQIAANIAAKSPLAVVGTKAILLKSRDMSMDQGLDYIATWNSSMLLSDDLMEAVQAYLKKRTPVFSRL